MEDTIDQYDIGENYRRNWSSFRQLFRDTKTRLPRLDEEAVFVMAFEEFNRVGVNGRSTYLFGSHKLKRYNSKDVRIREGMSHSGEYLAFFSKTRLRSYAHGMVNVNTTKTVIAGEDLMPMSTARMHSTNGVVRTTKPASDVAILAIRMDKLEERLSEVLERLPPIAAG